jgi:hypothetical protein
VTTPPGYKAVLIVSLMAFDKKNIMGLYL